MACFQQVLTEVIRSSCNTPTPPPLSLQQQLLDLIVAERAAAEAFT